MIDRWTQHTQWTHSSKCQKLFELHLSFISFILAHVGFAFTHVGIVWCQIHVLNLYIFQKGFLCDITVLILLPVHTAWISWSALKSLNSAGCSSEHIQRPSIFVYWDGRAEGWGWFWRLGPGALWQKRAGKTKLCWRYAKRNFGRMPFPNHPKHTICVNCWGWSHVL